MPGGLRGRTAARLRRWRSGVRVRVEEGNGAWRLLGPLRDALARRRISHALRDLFVARNGYRPHLRRPRTFNEKIQWLKLNYHDPLQTLCSDKLRMREYVGPLIGEEHTVAVLGSYARGADVDFDALPDRYVLKVNDGFAMNIVNDGSPGFDRDDARTRLDAWMDATDRHYMFSYEWAYRDIEPRIVCEEYLESDDPRGLVDYKVWCFNGRPEVVLHAAGRDVHYTRDYFDTSWNRLEHVRGEMSPTVPPKPEALERMLELATRLSQPFPFVRVDFYVVRGRILVGELSFYPSAGLEPFDDISWDRRFGRMLRLPRPRR